MLHAYRTCNGFDQKAESGEEDHDSKAKHNRLRQCVLAGQEERNGDRETRLPNGKSQQEEILKAEFQKTLQDAAELVKLARAGKVTYYMDLGNTIGKHER